jgi:Kef-type K+ transport system membrane component KefB
MMEGDPAARVAAFALQLAVVLMAARIAGELAERALRQPAVVGEIVAGVIIGPYALGGVALPGLGPVFPVPDAGGLLPVSIELYALGQLAAVLLLFVAGLETDLALFLRYLGPAALVGLGGVLVPFAAGAGATVLAGAAPSWSHPTALFVGAVMTATSVGITARVLADLERMDTPEAVTVLAAAVVDDVLAIMALAFVVNTSQQGRVSAGELGAVGLKAFGIWILITAVFLLGAARLERAINAFRSAGAPVALALAACFLAAWVAEAFGLAMIIGAYSAGLGLSARPLAHRLQQELQPIYRFLVPVFFVLVGMLVDVRSLGGAIEFALLITALAVATKIVGCAAPALAVGFNGLGAARIGVGMLPRGEVALIIASVGLTAGAIDHTVFGVAVVMTLVTTVLAPVVLMPLFRNPRSGRRGGAPSAVPTC